MAVLAILSILAMPTASSTECVWTIMCRSATEQSISRGRHSCPRGTSRMQMDGLRSHHTGVPDVEPPQHPEDCHSRRLHRRDLVDQCSAYACPMRAHAGVLRATTSTCWPARSRSSRATSRRAHPAYAYVRSVDKAPRNSGLRHEHQREPAGHSVVHWQKIPKN